MRNTHRNIYCIHRASGSAYGALSTLDLDGTHGNSRRASRASRDIQTCSSRLNMSREELLSLIEEDRQLALEDMIAHQEQTTAATSGLSPAAVAHVARTNLLVQERIREMRREATEARHAEDRALLDDKIAAIADEIERAGTDEASNDMPELLKKLILIGSLQLESLALLDQNFDRIANNTADLSSLMVQVFEAGQNVAQAQRRSENPGNPSTIIPGTISLKPVDLFGLNDDGEDG